MMIGITGAAGSGKDTFADYFIAQFGFERYGFADPIKRMIGAGFDLAPGIWDDRQAKETDLPRIGRSPRYLAQTLGTEWGRGLVHSDIWLLLADRLLQGAPKVVIPDVRFDNEAEWVRRRGGTIIQIKRNTRSAADNAGHSSEKGVNPAYFSHIVENFGTIEDLHTQALSLWYSLND